MGRQEFAKDRFNPLSTADRLREEKDVRYEERNMVDTGVFECQSLWRM